LLALAINFLAGFLSLGKVTDKIKEVIGKVRAAVDKAIDTAIAWIVAKAKALFGKLFGGKDNKDKKDERTEEQKKADLDKGVTEAQKHLESKKLTSEQVKKKLPAIKSKYKMTVLELVTDSKSGTKETVHIHGVINPEQNGGPEVKENLIECGFIPNFSTIDECITHAKANNFGLKGNLGPREETGSAFGSGAPIASRHLGEDPRVRINEWWCDSMGGVKKFYWTRVALTKAKTHTRGRKI
jgi:hypothetical protein